jgi:hypothetical protein
MTKARKSTQPKKSRDTDDDPVSVPPLRLEYRSPAELDDNPANWRTHPEAQMTALADVIAEVGWAGVCLFNELTKRLIDGHARKKMALATGIEKVPVLIGSWTEEQERKILATLDPLAALAEADNEKLSDLLKSVQTDSANIQALLDGLAKEVKAAADPQPTGTSTILEKYQILIEFENEQSQAEWLEKLTSEGLTCRSLIS